MRTFTTEFWLPCRPERAFAFFGDARNLNRVTPAWFRFDIQTPTPVPMAVGTRIDYRLHWRFLTFSWQSLVTDWSPSHRFVYEQAHGPFASFRHSHFFQSDPDGVRVIDRLDYELAAERLIGRWFVEPDLRRIFAHRARAAARLLV